MNLVDYNARVCFTENEWRSPFSACVCVVLWWRCEWVERYLQALPVNSSP